MDARSGTESSAARKHTTTSYSEAKANELGVNVTRADQPPPPRPEDRPKPSAAYLRLVGWFVVGITAMGFYVWLALVNVNLFLIWPLLVIVGLSIFKCWTAADGPVGSRWP